MSDAPQHVCRYCGEALDKSNSVTRHDGVGIHYPKPCVERMADIIDVARETLEWYADGHRLESDCNALGVDDGALAAEALAKLPPKRAA